MPFTLSHIAAVIPIAKVVPKLPLSALAVGAMIPDLTLFFPVSNYHFAHSPWGLLFFCLPWGLLAYVFFECIGKHFTIACLPIWMQRRLVPYRQQPLPVAVVTWCWVVVAILIGALTHVLWDSCTHAAADTFVGAFSPHNHRLFNLHLLDKTVHYGELSLPIYKYLQYLSSVMGLILIVVVGFLNLRREPAQVVIEPVAVLFRRFVAVLIVAIPLMVLVCYELLGFRSARASHVVIDSITIMLIVWGLASLMYMLVSRASTRR